jgi:hypothetical protein
MTLVWNMLKWRKFVLKTQIGIGRSIVDRHAATD